MIRANYHAQVAAKDLQHKFRYTWSGRVLSIELYNSQTGEIIASDSVDFSSLAPGDYVLSGDVEVSLDGANPIVLCECDENGDLNVELILWYDGVNLPQEMSETISEV